ncbi:hypothetical protein DEI92_01150 [Curtobacterium sp. MCBD17_034]|uniref:RHS repeat protein n=1 Tax=unclassified Curtobacterium TaxID=257496 RepID=UPI000DA766CE|nr:MULTISPECIES: RHS repeat protein [unclassified Curtobacterium]PZF62146.1 hypothetical protein DEI92_01150 [Curtobacterium sp. MCBD17_034]PZM33920.1 hypothetical protein DEI90_09555 [Curtobacterium sp. MCBD17_031]
MAVVAAALTATPATAASLSAAPGTSVTGHVASPALVAAAPASSTSVSTPAVSRLSGTYTVALNARRWTAVGGTGIQVKSQGSSSSAVRSVSISVVSSTTGQTRHLDGLALDIKRTDRTTRSGAVQLQVPRSLLTNAGGADVADRTTWVTLPAGAALSATNATPVTTTASSGSVVLTPKITTTATTVAATSGPVSASGTGSFAAAPTVPSSAPTVPSSAPTAPSVASSAATVPSSAPSDASSAATVPSSAPSVASAAPDVAAQTGSLSWTYPMAVPPAAAGPTPHLALAYDSQSVDRETGSTNNQPSAIGDGWSLTGGGSIQRQYVSCSRDDSAAVATSGDLCWRTDNATLELDGHSTPLVRDSATGAWHLQADDGSRLEHLVGTAHGCAANGTSDTDCWRLTTTDGTQYWFGLNELPGWAKGKATTNSAWTVPVFGNGAGEPCHASTFASSSCMQAWRWNLDYVVDTHGNAEAYYYDAETNSYGKDGSSTTSYIRGGQLDHVDYGLTRSTVYSSNAATARASFGYDAYGRCSDTTHKTCTKESITAAATKPATASAYPDVPWDQSCSASCSAHRVPTFWTDAMLDTVTTSVRSGSGSATVDKWTLSHSFPSPGDGTSAALWLTQVQHTGYAGSTSISEPATRFAGVRMQNRVSATGGLAPLDKWRISSITAATGAVTSVNYSAQQCTAAQASAIEAAAASNDERCFPQPWASSVVPAAAARQDLFHEYVVTSVVRDPRTGGGNDPAQETDYVYTGTPAWRYDTSPSTPVAQRTWSVPAGFDRVEVREGAPTTPAAQKTTDYTFFRGLDGDRAAASGGTKTVAVTGRTIPDSRWFAGRVYEEKDLDGVGGSLLSDTVHTPWAGSVEADDGLDTARVVADGNSTTTEPIASGGSRTTQTTATYDAHGDPTSVTTATSDAGTTCVTTSYAPANTDAWIVDLPQEVTETGAACGGDPGLPADVVSDTETSYDGHAFGAVPTVGDATSTRKVTSYSGSTPVWTTTDTSTYDALGRRTSSRDALGRTTTTAYTPAVGGPVTRVTTTNPMGWTSTTGYDGTRGEVLTQTAADGGLTTTTYDALGRRTDVWLPGRPRATYPTSPSSAYAYTESQTAPSAVATTTLNATTSVTTDTLFDGLGQQVQTQAPSPSGGSIVTDDQYDAQGRVVVVDHDYWASAVAPSAKLFVPANQQQIQSSTQTQYDAAGRTLVTATRSFGKELYRTTDTYPGSDEVVTTPPSGGIPTATSTDSFGRRTKLVQYLGSTPSSSTGADTTTYGYDAAGQMTSMTDPAGNESRWTYDLQGDQVSAVDPDSGTTTATYDLDGEQLTRTDARGRTVAYTYDDDGRRTAEYDGSTSGALLDSWTYDSRKVGQLTSSSSYTGSVPGVPGAAYTTSYSGYNAYDEPTGETISIPSAAPAFGGTTYTLAYGYAVDGSLLATTYGAMGGLAAEKVVTNYSALGDPVGIGGAADYGDVLVNALGQVAQIDRGGTVANSSAYSYDEATGALTGIEDMTGTGSATVVQADRTYHRNDAGVITSAVTTGAAGSEAQCYGHDALQELTDAWTPASGSCSAAPTASGLSGAAPYWHTYSYDTATGNRLSETDHSTTGGPDTTSTYAYPAAGSNQPHAAQSVTTTDGTTTTTDQLAYDADGDTTSLDGRAVAYDADGGVQSITAADGGQVQGDVHDANGRLLLQDDRVDGASLVVGDTELHQAPGSTTVTASRTYSVRGITVAERDTDGTGAATVWLLDADVDGTVDLESNSRTGAVVRRWFDPFGVAVSSGAGWSSDHGFLDQPTSSSTGLTEVGPRVLDSALGRYLAPQTVPGAGAGAGPDPRPTGVPQSDQYSYGANDPVTPTGPGGAWSSTVTGPEASAGAVRATEPPAAESGAPWSR